MPTKAQLTTQYIIEKVAPVFNRLGYEATSMADIASATGLTKGAIYGNFENKEALAIAAFNHNIRKVMGLVGDKMNEKESAVDKLFALTAFYKTYHAFTMDLGGCPLLNVGVDTNNLNSPLHIRVVLVLKKLQSNIAVIIQQGIDDGVFKPDLNTQVLGSRMVSLIEGAIFTATMLKDHQPLVDMMEFIEEMIINDFKK